MDNTYKRFSIVTLISLTFVLYMYRMIIPALKYPFLVAYFAMIALTVVTQKVNIGRSIKLFIREFYLAVILVLLLCLSFFLSNKLYLIVFKDIVNSIIIVSLLPVLLINIKDQEDVKNLLRSIINIFIYFSALLSVIVIFQPKYISLTYDYNFISLFILLGLIAITSELFKSESKIEKYVYNILLVILSAIIIISGSRRALILFLFFFISIIIIISASFFKNREILRKIRSNLQFFVITEVIIFFLFGIFLYWTSNHFKEEALHLLRFSESSSVKNKLVFAIHRYSSAFNTNQSFEESYDEIWNRDYLRALDPESGWGKLKHTKVFPLKGKKVNIVPSAAKGYLLDSTGIASISNGNAISKTIIESTGLNAGDILNASVFCFTSKDFNGDSICLKVEGVIDTSVYYKIYNPNNNRGILNLFQNGDFKIGTKFWDANADSTKHEIINTPFGTGIRVSRTDGDGQWWSLRYNGRPIIYYAGHEYQMEFKYKIIRGNQKPFNIGWWVNDAGSIPFSLPLNTTNLVDGWIQAECSYKFNNTHYHPATFLNSMQDNSVIDLTDIKLIDKNLNDSIPLYVDEIEDFDKGIWQNLALESLCSMKGKATISLNFLKPHSPDFSTLRGYVIFACPRIEVHSKSDQQIAQNIESDIISSDNVPTDSVTTEKDPIRMFAANLVPQDTTFIDLKSQITIKTIPNKFIGDRLMRWEFAVNIFWQEYSLMEKIFGRGFNFLQWYGNYFLHDKSTIDYPHNPLLSVLLYSGLFGLSIYLILLVQVLITCIRCLKVHYVFSLFFFISFLFSFFSAGSPFDPPITGCFLVLSLFLDHKFRQFHFFTSSK